MILEVATVVVKPGLEEEFEKGVCKALVLFRRALCYRSLQLERSIESPSSFRLVIGWDTLADHQIHFRNSEDFQHWRALVGHMFAGPPLVEHSTIVLSDSEAVGEPGGD